MALQVKKVNPSASTVDRTANEPECRGGGRLKCQPEKCAEKPGSLGKDIFPGIDQEVCG
jgi:hypothetical protein